MGTNREVGIVVDKGDAEDLTRTISCKHRMSGKENADTWTSRKSKVSFFQMRMLASLTVHIFVKKGMDFRIKFHVGKKRSMVKISVNIT
jgi:hypothetical protein